MTVVRIPAQAVQLQHLHPKITARAIGGNTCVVSPSAPGSPYQGDLWINPANSNQLSQWTGSSWLAVPLNAGSLTGENFDIGTSGQFHYASPPAFNTWSFESGLAGWTASNATIIPSNAQANVGAYSALLTYTSGPSWSASSPPQQVSPGKQVYTAAWVKAPQALGAVGLQLAWYNTGGTLLSTSSAPTAALAANTGTQLAYNATPPAGSASCVIIVQDNESSVTGNQLYIDDVYISGQLTTSVAPSAGTDQVGNAHPAGVAALGTGGAQAVLAADNSNVPWVQFMTGIAEETTHGRLQVQVGLPGTAAELPVMFLVGPGVTGQTGIPGITMYGAAKNLSTAPFGALFWVENGTTEYLNLVWNGSSVSVNAPLSVNSGLTTAASSLSGGVIISQADISFTAQPNPTSPSRICKVWPIPAGDPLTGTVYRLSIPFSGTWQANPLSFQIAALGTALGKFTVGGTLMSAGAGFCGDLTATVIVNQTTSGAGILTGSIRCNLGVNSANQLPTPGANGSGGFSGLSVVEGISGIGASNSSIAVQASFGASNSGQSIEGFGSVLERIGGNA